jgi:formate/nitrite transporter FocA (FNT family)
MIFNLGRLFFNRFHNIYKTQIKMSKNKKIILGVLTLLPIVFLVLYFLSFIFLFLGIFNSAQNQTEPDVNFFIGNFIFMFLLIFIAVIAALGTMIYYIIHITNNTTFDSNQRLMWILILVFAGLIGNAVYWYMYIWKEQETVNG